MPAMTYRAARLTGAPIMECPDCGAVCAYWDADDMTPNPVTGALELHCGQCSPCAHGAAGVKTCGGCGRAWCEDCDPSPAALCHYCHGRGYSLAPVGGA